MPRKTMVFKANAGPKYIKAVEDFYGQELQNSGASKNPYDIHMSFGSSTEGVKIGEAVSFAKSIQNDISGIKRTIYMVPEKIDLYIDSGNLTNENDQSSRLKVNPTRDNNWLMVHYKLLSISQIKPTDINFQSEFNKTKYHSAQEINAIFAKAAAVVNKPLSEYSKPEKYEPHVSIAKIDHNNITGFRKFYEDNKGELFNKFVQNVPTLAIFDFKLEHMTNNAQQIKTDLPLNHKVSSWHSYFSTDDVEKYAKSIRDQEVAQAQDDKGKEPEDSILFQINDEQPGHNGVMYSPSANVEVLKMVEEKFLTGAGGSSSGDYYEG